MDTDAGHLGAETPRQRRLEPAVTPSGETLGATHAAVNHGPELVRSEHVAAAMLTLARNRRDRMIAISSDELRGHLARIRNAAEVFKLAAPASAQAQRVAAILERQVARMARLLDELVASAQSCAPESILRRVETTVQIVVTRGVEIVEPLICARRQTLSIRMPVGPLRLEADPMWLTHAVRNVIGGAVKYTEPGGRIAVLAERHGALQ